MLAPVKKADEETVLQAGEPGREMFIVSSGKVECFNIRSELQLTFKRGALFGEWAACTLRLCSGY